jgi:hypothetical protein
MISARGAVAREGLDIGCRELCDHACDGRVQTQTATSQRTQEVQGVEGVHQQLLPEASHPSLHTAVNTDWQASRCIERFFREDGVVLAVVSNHQDGGEGIRELENAKGANEGEEIADLWDSSR